MRQYLIQFDGDIKWLPKILDTLDTHQEPLETYLKSDKTRRSPSCWDFLIFANGRWSVDDWSEDEEEREEEYNNCSDLKWVTPEKFISLFGKRKRVGGI